MKSSVANKSSHQVHSLNGILFQIDKIQTIAYLGNLQVVWLVELKPNRANGHGWLQSFSMAISVLNSGVVVRSLEPSMF